MAWGLAIAAGVSALGSYFGSKKESSAARKARKLLASYGPEVKKAQEMIDPWDRYRGQYATQLHQILQGDRDWTADPGYQFRVAEDARAVERAAGARGSNISGNVMTELASRRQEMASAEYSNVINRLIGLSAATPENAIAGGSTYAQGMLNLAGAQASSILGEGAADGRAISSLLTGLGSAMAAGYGGAAQPAANNAVSNVSAGQFGNIGTNLTGWGQQGSGGWENTFTARAGQSHLLGGSPNRPGTSLGSLSGASSSVGSIW